jgi:hypothetical protein
VSKVVHSVSASVVSTRYVIAFSFAKERCSTKWQLVDTKSVNNTTLLHFLEKTVSKHFPDMAAFLDELEAPAEAHRGNLTLYDD